MEVGFHRRKDDAVDDTEVVVSAVTDAVELPTADGTDPAYVSPVGVEYPTAAAALVAVVVKARAAVVSGFLVHAHVVVPFRAVGVIVVAWPALAVLPHAFPFLVSPSRDLQLPLVPVPTSLLPVCRNVDVDNRADTQTWEL